MHGQVTQLNSCTSPDNFAEMSSVFSFAYEEYITSWELSTRYPADFIYLTVGRIPQTQLKKKRQKSSAYFAKKKAWNLTCCDIVTMFLGVIAGFACQQGLLVCQTGITGNREHHYTEYKAWTTLGGVSFSSV